MTKRPVPNIVLIGVDTLRPDHLGCHGYRYPTSPAIDALASESVVFENAIAAGIPTTPSFTTLLSGLHPYQTSVITHPGRNRLGEDILLLPQLAKANGYVTAACDNMVVQGAGRGTWFARGYDHYSGFLYSPFGDQSTKLTDTALSFLREQNDRPSFLFMHYWDPHTPYGPRPPYDTMHYEPGSGPYDLAEVRAELPDYYNAFLGEMDLANPDDYAYVVAQYDGEISQVDAQIGRLIEGMRELEVWDDTIFLLVSDHGECFGEGGLHFDHHGLYDAVTNIAMMMRVPGQGAARVDSLASHEDVVPTVCELAGLTLPEYPLTGRSLTPTFDGTPVRSEVVSVECSRQASLAYRTETEKFILPITENAAGTAFPDWAGRPRCADPLLFDLRADPQETRNLAAERPDRAKELAAELEAWREQMLAGRPDPILAQDGLSLPYEHFLNRVHKRKK